MRIHKFRMIYNRSCVELFFVLQTIPANPDCILMSCMHYAQTMHSELHVFLELALIRKLSQKVVFSTKKIRQHLAAYAWFANAENGKVVRHPAHDQSLIHLPHTLCPWSTPCFLLTATFSTFKNIIWHNPNVKSTHTIFMRWRKTRNMKK